MSSPRLRGLWFLALLGLPLSAMAETTICGSGFEPSLEHCRTFGTDAEADAWFAKQRANLAAEAAPLGRQVNEITMAILSDRLHAGTWPMNGNALLRCLTILDKDPSRKLLGAMKKNGLPLSPGKQSICQEDSDINSIMRYFFYEFKPIAQGKVKVHWGYACGRNCAGGYVSEVEIDTKGHWVVVRTELNWMT